MKNFGMIMMNDRREDPHKSLINKLKSYNKPRSHVLDFVPPKKDPSWMSLALTPSTIIGSPEEGESNKTIPPPPPGVRQVIPKHVYQTWITRELPPDMKICNNLLREQNPEFEFHLYDDDDCRRFIQNNYDENVLRAFDKLVPGAFKADLWRYCILYKYGGIYLDCKYFCMSGFRLAHLLSDEYFVRDVVIDDIFNAVMVCKPQNPILWDAIHQVVKNVREGFYGTRDLSVTGPEMMRDIFSKHGGVSTDLDLSNKGSIVMDGIPLNGCIYSEKYNKIIMATYPSYRYEQDNYSKKKHYGIYWNNRQVYDESAPSPR